MSFDDMSVAKLEASALSVDDMASSTGGGLGGFSTPPSVKKEPRRSSLAYSAFSETSFTASTPPSVFSQPVTPSVKTQLRSNGFISDWTGDMGMDVPFSTPCKPYVKQRHESSSFYDAVLPFVPRAALPMSGFHAASNLLNTPFHPTTPGNTTSMETYEVVYSPNLPLDYDTNPGLKATLFPPMYDFGAPDPAVVSSAGSYSGLSSGSFATSLHEDSSASVFDCHRTRSQNGQIPMPSQLDPHDLLLNSDPMSFVESNPGDVTNNPLHSVDAMKAEYMLIDNDVSESPSKASHRMTLNENDDTLAEKYQGQDISNALNNFPLTNAGDDLVEATAPYDTCSMHPDRDMHHSVPSMPLPCRSRSRRVTSRRGRKATAPSSVARPEPWRVHYDPTLDIHVQFEGTPFTTDFDEEGNLKSFNVARGTIYSSTSSSFSAASSFTSSASGVPSLVRRTGLPSSKQHACTECPARFARVEHLKRHALCHLKDPRERPFFCPLPRCGRRMSRPDNARDHLKTHLRTPAPGKRNAPCTWAEMAHEIRSHYPSGKAEKWVQSLEAWMRAEEREGKENDRPVREERSRKRGVEERDDEDKQTAAGMDDTSSLVTWHELDGEMGKGARKGRRRNRA